MTNFPSQHRPCVSVVLMNPEGRILLVHKPRKRDAWQFPQGGIEEGESLQEAASRELREETGIEVATDDFTMTDIHYQYDYPASFMKWEKPKYAGQHLTFIVTTVPRETLVKVDQRELDTFLWIKPSDLGKYLKRKEYLEVVQKVLDEFVRKVG